MDDCRKAREALWPADIMRVSDEAVEAALEHAAHCPDCLRFLEEDRRMARLIRESVPRVRAPRELRERLYTALARERAGSVPPRRRAGTRRRWSGLAMLVAGGLALAAAGHWVSGRAARADAARAFAEDYLRRVVEEDELRTSDPQAISAFFARELGVAMPPPTVPEFKVRRATICLMHGRRGGVVEYYGRRGRLTFYLIPNASGDPVDSEALLAASRPDASDPALAEERGLGVATWWDGSHQHALVGDLPAHELKRLAPLFACPVSRL